MLECESQGYQFRHEQRIHLDQYQGIAGDIMELNDPVADGFMQTADMRGDVVITQRSRERTRDYDQIGDVKVAKVLQMPRLNFWRGNGITETRKDDGETWYIAINDQELADQVARAGNRDKKFDARFVEAFRAEVIKGLKTCLKGEKLFNGGNYDLSFYVAYYYTAAVDLVLFPSFLGAKIASGDNPAEALAVSSSSLALANATINVACLAAATIPYLETKLFGPIKYRKRMPNFNDPFIKHSLPELVLPPVPIDRLFRGIIYLNKHRERIITPMSE